MLDLRRTRLRTCGLAVIFLVAVLWPMTAPVRSAAADPADTPVFWLAPTFSATSFTSPLALAADDLANGKPSAALLILTRVGGSVSPNLGGYSLLYLAKAQLALNKLTEARASAARLVNRQPSGYLADAVRWLMADIAEAAGDWAAAESALRALAVGAPVEPERTWLRLGLAAIRAGDTAEGITALRKVYFEFPLSPQAVDAALELARVGPSMLSPSSPDDWSRLWTRAQALFDARRYSDARTTFAALQASASAADRTRVALRLAECDFFLKRYLAARDRLRPLADDSPEAEFYLFSILREQGRREEYLSRARAFIAAHPADPLAESALNDLATHFILANEDERAADTFAELVAKFPAGAHADRAALKGGWWRYRTGAYTHAIRMFEPAADAFPRNDYRPLWMYWAARAHQKLGERELAVAGFRRVIADYRNSYYGREASRRLADLGLSPAPASGIARALPSSIAPGTPPPNAAIIRELLGAGLFDAAILELEKARVEGGASPLLDATIAYALNRRGDRRAGIIRMRAAYPQFRADGGELLPADIRRVIFPMAHWDLVQFQAKARELDPYLMAALINQESNFDAGVKSAAGAWGLMQIMPTTGRKLAAKLNIRPYSTARLKSPEVNVRIGMLNFANVMVKFGDVVPALAAYNAGDSRVTRWLAERQAMHLDQDEFIDDIPFPETQNYVKRILGTTDDYRALYGDPPASVRR